MTSSTSLPIKLLVDKNGTVPGMRSDSSRVFMCCDPVELQNEPAELLLTSGTSAEGLTCSNVGAILSSTVKPTARAKYQMAAMAPLARA